MQEVQFHFSHDNSARCLVPSCDLDRHHFANSTSFAFALPPDDDGCHLYHYTGPDPESSVNASALYCNPNYFDKSDLEVCSDHVYDETEYQWSFAMQVDLAPCAGMQGDEWPFQVKPSLRVPT